MRTVICQRYFFQKAITKLDTQGIRVRVRFSSTRNGYSKLGEKIFRKNFQREKGLGVGLEKNSEGKIFKGEKG